MASTVSDTEITITTSAGVQTNQTWSSAGGDPVTAVMCAFLDGFFIVQRPEVVNGQPANQINISGHSGGGQGAGTFWDPLDFAVKEGYADHIRSTIADHEQLYLFGTEKSECWQNTGALFPFVRIAGAAVHVGAVSSYAQVSIGGALFFLGGDGTGGTAAYVLNGFTPVRISTHAIEQQWNKQGGMYNAVAYSYLEEGHYFWVIDGGQTQTYDPVTQTWTRLGSLGHTFAYDTTTQAWTRRARWSGTAWLPYGTRFHAFLPEWGGVHVTSGDPDTTRSNGFGGNLYTSSINFYDDNGGDLHWERCLPYIWQDGKQIYMDRLVIETETGTTTSTTVEPTIQVDWSDDRGQTFSTPISLGTGLAGDFTKRVYLNQLGGSRGRALRFSGTGQNKIALISADLDMRQGSH